MEMNKYIHIGAYRRCINISSWCILVHIGGASTYQVVGHTFGTIGTLDLCNTSYGIGLNGYHALAHMCLTYQDLLVKIESPNLYH
jgi:hypothetical protein